MRWPKMKPTVTSRRDGSTLPPDMQPVGVISRNLTETLEEHCLGVLLRRPDLIFQVDRNLLSTRLNRLSVQDFQRGDHQAIFRLLVDSLGQDEVEPLSYVLNGLSQTLMESAESLLEMTHELNLNDERVIEDLMRGIIDLRRRELNQQIEQLRFLMEAEQEDGDLRASVYAETMQQYVQGRKLLDQALGQYTHRAVSVQK